MKYLLTSFFIIFYIFNTSAQEELGLLGQWTDDSITPNGLNARYNEVWGIAINNHEYAILGSTYGTHFIDVTNPEDPVEKFVVKGQTTGAGIIHRDYHDYKGYLYAVSDEGGSSTLQIIDYKYLPDSVHIVYDSQDLIRRTHNIFIDSTSGRLYSLLSSAPALGYAAMRIFDLSNPEQPTLLASHSSFDGYNIGHVHDAYIRNDTAYMNCGPDGFIIADFQDPENPTTISILETNEYPQSGYNHSGWLTDDGNYYIMADETWGKDMKILDVSNLPEIEVIDTIGLPDFPDLQIPHNQVIMGDYLYASYYVDGVQIWNLSDIDNPEITHYYPTSNITHLASYFGNWGVYPFLPSGILLASDLQMGLFVLNGVSTVGTKEIHQEESTLKLYPNPSSDKIIIELHDIKTEANIIIYNMNGEAIHKATVSKDDNIYTYNFPINMARGSYVVELSTSTRKYLANFMVQ